MKKITTIAVILITSSCGSKKGLDVVGVTQEYLKSQMKDPSSFQVITASIQDTVKMSQWLTDRYKEDTAMISKTIRDNKVDADIQFLGEGHTEERAKYEKLLDGKTDIYRKSAEKNLKEINSLKQDRIFYIAVRIDYRAKNSFGAVGAESKTINYYPLDSSFKMEE